MSSSSVASSKCSSEYLSEGSPEVSSDSEYESEGETEGSLTYPLETNKVKKGLNVMIKGHPCKVSLVTTSSTGKHGHAKANITGVDIFNGKKHIDIVPTSHKTDALFVYRNTYQVQDLDQEGFLTLMNDDMEIREDLKISEDTKDPHFNVYEKIRNLISLDKGCLVVVLKTCGIEKIVEAREDTE